MSDEEEFPTCPDCGQKHLQLPKEIVLKSEDLWHIQNTFRSLLDFSEKKRIPLTVLSGMVQTFHAEIMEELMEIKRALDKQVSPVNFLAELQEFLKGGPNGGFQKETGRTETKAGSGESSKDSGSSESGSKDSSGGGHFH